MRCKWRIKNIHQFPSHAIFSRTRRKHRLHQTIFACSPNNLYIAFNHRYSFIQNQSIYEVPARFEPTQTLPIHIWLSKGSFGFIFIFCQKKLNISNCLFPLKALHSYIHRYANVYACGWKMYTYMYKHANEKHMCFALQSTVLSIKLYQQLQE